LTACGGDTGSSPRALPNEERIQNDLALNSRGTIPAGQSIDSLEIVDSETDNDAGVHDVICKIFSNDGEVAYIKYLLVMYQRNAEREWVLASVNTTRSNLWSTSPLAGVRDALVMETIMGAVIRIDDDDWVIDGDSMVNVSITSRDTDLERYSDVVVASVKLQSDVLTAEGQMQVEFNYSDGWQLSERRVSAPFIASFLPHAVLDVTNDSIISEIAKKTILFSQGNTAQLISLSNDEIYDFSFSRRNSQNKGTVQAYDCTFRLNKGIATLSVDASVIYRYDTVNGWGIYEISLLPEIISVDIEGEWIGQYAANQGATRLLLSITDVASDGSITAIFSFSALPTNPLVASGSFRMIGGIDFNDLRIILVGKEWIDRPGTTWRMLDLEGYLHIDNSTITSVRGISFEATLTIPTSNS
jgi:hypothetical protein